MMATQAIEKVFIWGCWVEAQRHINPNGEAVLVSPSVSIGKGVTIEVSLATSIGEGVVLGDNVTVLAGAKVLPGVTVPMGETVSAAAA